MLALLMVSAGHVSGSPAFSTLCLAGFCPQPAVRTWPMITWHFWWFQSFPPTSHLVPPRLYYIVVENVCLLASCWSFGAPQHLWLAAQTSSTMSFFTFPAVSCALTKSSKGTKGQQWRHVRQILLWSTYYNAQGNQHANFNAADCRPRISRTHAKSFFELFLY